MTPRGLSPAAATEGGASAERGRPRSLFRIVVRNPPLLDDFTSNEAKGRVPPRSLTEEQRRQWSGLSVFERRDQAERLARRRAGLGRFIAELRLPSDGSISCQRTNLGSPGHYTLWGDPALILQCVVRVYPVE